MYPQAMTRNCRPTGYRSRAAGGVLFAQPAVIFAAGSGAVELRRAEFLKETLAGWFESGCVFSTDKHWKL